MGSPERVTNVNPKEVRKALRKEGIIVVPDGDYVRKVASGIEPGLPRETGLATSGDVWDPTNMVD